MRRSRNEEFPRLAEQKCSDIWLRHVIRTVAELLSQVVGSELPKLAATDIKQGPTIGDMYEGLSTSVLSISLPEGLDLQVVSGFAENDLGTQSGQIDCMIVHGKGRRIPYTDSFIWPVDSIIAVVEVKKTLHSREMIDAWDHLQSIRVLEREQRDLKADLSPDEPVDISLAERVFSEATGIFSPGWFGARDLPLTERLIFHNLIIESKSIVRVILGFHGFAKETSFREALIGQLKDHVGEAGTGPGSFPNLIVSGQHCAVKANGRPYSARVVEGRWPFYLSMAANPLLLFLELVWTRLDEMFEIVDPWGDDLVVQTGRGFIFGEGVERNGRTGWHMTYVRPSEAELSAIEPELEWEPWYLSQHEFVLVNRLCAGLTVDFADQNLVDWLTNDGIDPDVIKGSLVGTRLVASAGSEIRLITRSCACAILSTGELVAGDNNTGRLERWIAIHDSRMPPSEDEEPE